MKINDARAAFELQLRANSRSPLTLAQYGRHIALLARWMRDERLPDDLAALTHGHIARFFASDLVNVREDGARKRNTTTNACRTGLRQFFGYLHAAGHLGTDPTRLVRRARCAPPPPKPMLEAHAAKLMATITASSDPLAARDGALFGLMLWAGPRVGSVLAARVDDLEGDELVLERTKGDRPTRVYLPARVRDLLRAYLGARASGWLFPGRHGGPLERRSAAVRLDLWCERAGVPSVGIHGLRHAFAASVYAVAKDVLVVQTAMHHQSIASSLVYARADAERVRAVIDLARDPVVTLTQRHHGHPLRATTGGADCEPAASGSAASD